MKSAGFSTEFTKKSTNHHEVQIPDKELRPSGDEERHFDARTMSVVEIIVSAPTRVTRNNVSVDWKLLFIDERSHVNLVHVLGVFEQLDVRNWLVGFNQQPKFLHAIGRYVTLIFISICDQSTNYSLKIMQWSAQCFVKQYVNSGGAFI